MFFSTVIIKKYLEHQAKLQEAWLPRKPVWIPGQGIYSQQLLRARNSETSLGIKGRQWELRSTLYSGWHLAQQSLVRCTTYATSGLACVPSP